MPKGRRIKQETGAKRGIITGKGYCNNFLVEKYKDRRTGAKTVVAWGSWRRCITVGKLERKQRKIAK